jgi:hypothetical protein
MLRNIQVAGFPGLDKFLIAFSQCPDHDMVKTQNTLIKEGKAKYTLVILCKIVPKGMYPELDNATKAHYLNIIILVMGLYIQKTRLTQYCK